MFVYWGYKIRIFPTKEQEVLLWKHINTCRFVWNYLLALQEERYRNGEKHLSAYSMGHIVTELKHDGNHEWMNDVSYNSMNRVCANLDNAYDRYFKKVSNSPRFKKKKKTRSSYPVRNNSIVFYDDVVSVEKIGKLKYKTSYDIPKGRGIKFCESAISFVNNKWILSVSMIRESQAVELTDKAMGIDLGVKETAVVAYGDEQITFHNINKSKVVRQAEQRLKHLQRNVSRKYCQNNSFKKTKNILKAEAEVARASLHITNIRLNYTHQITHKLVELKPCVVTMENLGIANMLKNKHLAKQISQQNMYEFIRQMKYKCEYYNIPFKQVGRFYPSSKTCSCCGSVKTDLRLKDRVFVCDDCGLKIDRDYNAAINLMKYGLA